MTRRPTLALVVVLLALLAAACDEGERPAPASPSSAFPTETSPPPTATGGQPTTPGPAGGEGSVSFQLAGDAELETTLDTLVTTILAEPPGGFALVWSGGSVDPATVGLGGASFVGTRPTSSTLTLTIAAQTGAGFGTWISSAGECDVTIDVAEAHRLAGSFACEDLGSSDGRVVDVSGRFEATG